MNAHRRAWIVLPLFVSLLLGAVLLAQPVTAQPNEVSGQGDGLFVPIDSERILDTRDGTGATGPLGADSSMVLQVGGVGGVPDTGVGAVAMNLTATRATTDTYITVWDTGVTRPTASSVNVSSGQTVANLVIVPLAEDGTVSLYNRAGSVHVIADVVGYFPTGSDFRPVSPKRILDTRIRFGARGPVGERDAIDVQVLGEAGVPSSGVGAVVVNLTGTQATRRTFVTAYPSDADRPDTSNLNIEPRESRPNLVVVPVGRDGRVRLYNERGAVHLIADVLGWVPSASEFHVQRPQRILDSRSGLGLQGPIPSQTKVTLQVAGRGGVPALGARVVALNLTGTAATQNTWVRVWSGVGRPFGSSLNLRAGQTRANVVFVRLSPTGTITLFHSAGTVELIADVLGWIGTDGGGGTTTTTPSSTTSTTLPPTTTSTTTTSTTSTSTTSTSTTSTSTTSTTLPPTTTSTTTTSTTSTSTTLPPTSTTSTTSTTTSTTLPPTSTSTTSTSTTLPPTTSTSTTTSTTLPPTTSSTTTSSTTSTTTPPTSDGTTTTDGSTTTSTTIPVDPRPTAWRFDHNAVTLTEPGQSVIVQLRQVDADGDPTGATPPADPPVQQLGDTGAVIVDDLGNGRYRFTATDVIGSIVLAVDVPGQDLDQAVSVMNARLQPGVVTVPDSALLFPPPGVPATADLPTAGVPGIDATHVGPFTWQELRDRALISEAATPGTPYAGARIPLVLVGPAPAVGATLYGLGDSHVAGTVVTPAGLPTIERDGYSLVSVRVELFTDLFSQIHWDFTYDDFASAALVPLAFDIDQSCPDAVPADACPQPTVTQVIAGVNDQAGGSRATHSVAPTMAPGLAPTGLPGDCEASGSASVADVKFLGAEALHPKGQWLASDGTGGVGVSAQVEFGFDLTVTVGASVKLQLTGAYTVNCNLRKLAQFEVPAELLGPWANLVTPFLDADVVGVATAQFGGGPRLDLGASCSWTFQVRAGFRYIEGQGVTSRNRFDKVPNDTPCPPGTASGTVGTPANSPVTIDLTLFGGPKLTAGVHFGGIATHWLGDLFGDKDYGDFPILAGKVGPQLHVNWENSQYTLTGKSAGATIALELTGDIAVEGPFLEWLLSKMGVGGGPGIGVQLVGATSTLATIYRPLNSSALTVQVSGEERPSGDSDTVEVRPGDTLRVESTLQYKASALAVTDAVPDGGSDWERPGSAFFVESDLFSTISPVPHAPGTDQTMVYSTAITPALCDSIGKDPKDIYLLANAPMLGVLPTPAYAGMFHLKCVPTAWEFREGDEITIERDKVADPHFVHIKHSGYAGYSWTLANTNGGGLPDWLTITDGGTVPFGTADIDVSISIDCSAMDPKEQTSVDVKAAVADPPSPSNPHEDTLRIKVDCRDPFIEVTPTVLQGSGSLTLKTWGHSVGVWKVDPASVAGAPEWLKTGSTINILQASGVYGDGMHQQTLAVTVEPWPDDCLAHRAVDYTVRFITEYRTGPQEDRKTAKVRIVRPARPQPGGCSTAEAGEAGDPHLRTFDGQYFDAQVLGEYTYVRPSNGQAGPVVQVRHELTNPFSLGLGRPTSGTAVAVSFEGHKVEVYGRSSLELLVDGVLTDLADTTSVEVGSGMVVTRGGSNYVIDSTGIVVVVSSWGAGMNVSVSAARGAPIEGLLGSPDGNAGNDLAPAGGSPQLLADVQSHGPALYALTDSWRLQSLDQSLFTRHYSGFDDANPVYTSAALEPYRQQVRDLLAAVGAICATSGGTANYLVDALALELSIGQPLSALGDYTCTYTVDGFATGGPSSQPVDGLQVTVDGPGVQPCTAVTNTAGYFSCTMNVDLDDLAAVSADGLSLQLTSFFPELPDQTVVAEPVIFDGHAPIGGTARLMHPIVVPMGMLPALQVSGHLLGAGGVPLVGTFNMYTVLYTANGAYIGQIYTPVTPSPYDGSYTVLNALPRNAATATVTIGGFSGYPADNRAVTVTNLTRETREVTLDVLQQPPTLHLHGTLTRNGAPEGPSWGFLIDTYRADGSYLGRYGVNLSVNQTTGAYAADMTLPNDTARALVLNRYYFGAFDEYTQEFTGLGPDEQRDAPYSFDYQSKTLPISGHITINGAAQPGIVVYDVTMYDAQHQAFSVLHDARVLNNGDHSITFQLSARTVSVDVRVRHNSGSPDGKLFTLPLTVGANPVDASFDDVLTTLAVSGHVACGGVAAAHITNQVTAYLSNDQGQLYSVQSASFTTDDNGDYTAMLRLPSTGGTAVLVVSNSCGQSGSVSVTTSVVPHTANSVVFDVMTRTIHIEGTIVGTPEQLAALDQFGLTMDSVERLANGDLIVGTGPRYLTTSVHFDGNDQAITAIDYSVDWILANGVESVDITLFQQSDPRVQLAQSSYGGLGEMDTSWVFNVDLNPSVQTTPLAFDFFVYENQIAQQFLPVQVEVHGYQFTTWDSPHVEVWSHTYDLETDGGAHLTGTVDLPADVTLARITLHINGDTQGWDYAVFITPLQPNAFSYPIDLSTTRFSYGGTINLDGCPSPLVFYRMIWTFTEEPTQPFDWDTMTWPGGELQWAGYVVPDAVPDENGEYHHQMTAHLPTDSLWVGTVYMDHSGAGTGSGSLSPNSMVGVGASETAYCA